MRRQKMNSKIKMKMARGKFKDLKSLQKLILNIKANLKEIYKN